MAEQRQTTARMPLLDRKGRVLRSSWAAEDLFIYNKEAVAFGGVKEWEYYQLFDERFVFRLLYGHSRFVGLARGEFWDRESGRHFVTGPVKFFPGDSYDLDFSAEDPHHLYVEEENFLLSLDYDGRYRRLRCRGGAFDVELMLPKNGCALSTANPFRRRRQFYCGFRRIFPELRGRVTLNGQDYPLGERSFAVAESGRGLLPRRLSRVCGVGCGEVGGRRVAILMGWGFGYATAGTENALFVDGELIKLNRIREKRAGESFLERSRFSTGEGRLVLDYDPEEDHYVRKKFPMLDLDSHRTVGTVSGRILLPEEELTVTELPFLCEHSHFNWW